MAVPRRLGLLVTRPPGDPRTESVFALARAALRRRDEVLIYLLDDGVGNLGRAEAEELRREGCILYCCALGARRRGIEPDRRAVFSGLYVLASMLEACDRFVSTG